MKKLSNLEREIFDLHRKQRQAFLQFKNREMSKVEVNYDMMEEELKRVNKRMRI